MARLTTFALLATALAPSVLGKLPFTDPEPGTKKGGDLTFYRPGVDPGLTGKGACGIQNNPNDKIIAIPHGYWDKIGEAEHVTNPNNHPLCNQEVEITTSTGKAVGKITDMCADCDNAHSLDVTPALAEILMGPGYKDIGRLKNEMTWRFVGADGGGEGSSASEEGPSSSGSPDSPISASNTKAGHTSATASVPAADSTSSASYDDGMYHPASTVNDGSYQTATETAGSSEATETYQSEGEPSGAESGVPSGTISGHGAQATESGGAGGEGQRSRRPGNVTPARRSRRSAPRAKPRRLSIA